MTSQYHIHIYHWAVVDSVTDTRLTYTRKWPPQICDATAELNIELSHVYKNQSNTSTSPTMSEYYRWTTNNSTPNDCLINDIRKKSTNAQRIGLIQSRNGKISTADLQRLHRSHINHWTQPQHGFEHDHQYWHHCTARKYGDQHWYRKYYHLSRPVHWIEYASYMRKERIKASQKRKVYRDFIPSDEEQHISGGDEHISDGGMSIDHGYFAEVSKSWPHNTKHTARESKSRPEMYSPPPAMHILPLTYSCRSEGVLR